MNAKTNQAGAGCAEVMRPMSPVEAAIERLNESVKNLHCAIDISETKFESVLCPPLPRLNDESVDSNSPLERELNDLDECIRRATGRLSEICQRSTL
jgi:hypothetical protein